MNYSFVFDSVAAYQSAKSSGGSIYSALQSSTYLSRSAVSFIEATGQTLIDGVNIIAPASKLEVGDTLLFRASDSTYWALKGASSWSSTALGSLTYNNTDLVSMGYTRVGYVLTRQGADCLIASLSDQGTLAWSTNTSTVVPDVATFGSVLRNNGLAGATAGQNYVSGSREVAESYGRNNYTLPVTRAEWETAVAGGNTITYTLQDYGSFTVDPADYDYDFEKWYFWMILCRFPATTGAMSDAKGKQNTNALIASGYDVPAASACNNYSVSGVSDFAAGKWWLPSCQELWYMLKNKSILKSKGMPITSSYYWSSTQYSASYAWLVRMINGLVLSNTKSSAYYVRAVSAFHISD